MIYKVYCNRPPDHKDATTDTIETFTEELCRACFLAGRYFQIGYEIAVSDETGAIYLDRVQAENPADRPPWPDAPFDPIAA